MKGDYTNFEGGKPGGGDGDYPQMKGDYTRATPHRDRA